MSVKDVEGVDNHVAVFKGGRLSTVLWFSTPSMCFETHLNRYYN